MKKDFNDDDALNKLVSLAKEIQICMFITDSREEEQNHTRPMTTIEVEEDGTMWFFTSKASQKVDEVKEHHEVHLVYADPQKNSFLDVWGDAWLITDKAAIADKWSPIVKAWFPEGVDDPDIALLKVAPKQAYYWDAGSGKMIAFFKMAVSAVTGKKLDEGDAGELRL